MPLNTGRAGLGVAVVNDRIHAIGGETGSVTGSSVPMTVLNAHVVGVNEEYDLASNVWTLKEPMHTPRSRFGIAVYNSTIYCIGGYYSTISYSENHVESTDYHTTSINEAYNPTTNTWSTLTLMPTSRHSVTANVVDGKIYVIGGVDDNGFSKTTEVYDPVTGTWATKTPSPYIVRGYSSAVVNDKIYVLGANLGSNGFTEVFIQSYDPATDTWSAGAVNDSWFSESNSSLFSLTATCAATSGVSAPKRIYFFDENSTHVYDTISDVWSYATPMLTERILVGVAVVDDIFYVIGGRSGIHGVITIMDACSENEKYIPIGFGTVSTTDLPIVSLTSPKNMTYTSNSVSLEFITTEATTEIAYSLDNKAFVYTVKNQTARLSGLSDGSHSIVMCAYDVSGNNATSEVVYFTVKTFPTLWLVVVASAIAGLLTFLIYFGHFKKGRATTKTQ